MSKSRQPQSYHQQRYFSSSHDSISTSYINRAANVSSAASELDLSRKARRKDLRGRLKLPTSVTLASSGEAPLLGAWRTAPGSTAGTNPPSTNHLNSTSSCNGTERWVSLWFFFFNEFYCKINTGGFGVGLTFGGRDLHESLHSEWLICFSRYGFRRGESYNSRLRTGSANWSFVFDPAGRLCYYWSMVVSLAFLYNFWVIIYRFAFREIDCKYIF